MSKTRKKFLMFVGLYEADLNLDFLVSAPLIEVYIDIKRLVGM